MSQLVSQIALSDGRTLSYDYDGEERIIRVEEFETLFEEKIVRMYKKTAAGNPAAVTVIFSF